MIIGIGGVSRSGKSFLAEALKQEFLSAGKTVEILDQDNFVLPTKDIPLIRDHVDWEIPDSIDWDRFKIAIVSAVDNFDIVIAEGLMIFWNESIYSQFDKRIMIGLTKVEFCKRKRVDLRWGKEPEWYIEHIWESFQKYGSIKDGIFADIVLDGGGDFDVSAVCRDLSSGS